MRRYLSRGGIILAAIFILCGKSNAQVIELACPAGTVSVQTLQTIDTITGKLRQNYCVDASGNVFENLTGSTTITTLNKQCYVDGVTNVSIAACDAVLGIANGQIHVATPQTISAAVTLSTNHDLICDGDQVPITLSTATAQLVQSANTHIKGCTILSSQTAGTRSIVATSVNNVGIENVTCNGGGACVFYNSVTNFRIDRIRYLGMTTADHIIFISASTNGHIISPRIEGPFTIPSTINSFRGIQVVSSDRINIDDPIIHDIDATQGPTYAGISCAGTSHMTITGGIISGLKNGDGVAAESNGSSTVPCSDFSVTGTISTGNGDATGAGSNQNTGDGLDIFNATRVHVSNVNATNNGNNGVVHHDGCEIQGGSYEVAITNTDCSNSGLHGVSMTGSPRVILTGVISSRNFENGVLIQDCSGTVNTVGTAVTYVSGCVFGLGWGANTNIVINGVTFKIASVQSSTALTLTASAGTQNGVSFVVSSYGFQILGGHFNENGQGLVGTQFQVGIEASGGATDGLVLGVTALDNQTTKTQLFGFRTDNTARAVLLLDNFRGNLTGNVLDNAGASPQLNDDGSTGNFANATGSFNMQTNLIQSQASSITMDSVLAGRDLIFNGGGVEQFRVKGSGGSTFTKPFLSVGTAATFTGTGACATFGTNNSGSFAGSSSCASVTAASTLTITFTVTAAHGYACDVWDETTRANLFQQTSHTTTSCTLTATSVTQNDVFVFKAIGF